MGSYEVAFWEIRELLCPETCRTNRRVRQGWYVMLIITLLLSILQMRSMSSHDKVPALKLSTKVIMLLSLPCSKLYQTGSCTVYLVAYHCKEFRTVKETVLDNPPLTRRSSPIASIKGWLFIIVTYYSYSILLLGHTVLCIDFLHRLRRPVRCNVQHIIASSASSAEPYMLISPFIIN